MFHMKELIRTQSCCWTFLCSAHQVQKKGKETSQAQKQLLLDLEAIEAVCNIDML